MKVLVNNKEQEVTSDTSVSTLAQSLQLPEKGIAIAVNNRMVSRMEWDGFVLKENDNIVIIKAACGG